MPARGRRAVLPFVPPAESSHEAWCWLSGLASLTVSQVVRDQRVFKHMGTLTKAGKW